MDFEKSKFLTIHKPSLGPCEVPQKFGPDRFSRFDVYRLQTNKQTSNIDVYLDSMHVIGLNRRLREDNVSIFE